MTSCPLNLSKNMRDIKFRIWDRQTCHYVENSCSLHCFSNWTIDPFTGKICDWVEDSQGFATKSADPGYYFDKTEIIKGKRYFAEQWIGEVDKKGVEIYEGDIVEYQLGSIEKIYQDKIGWEHNGWRMISFDNGISNSLCAAIVTVIGSVNENKNLLK
jgi:hypothetical protein